MTTIMGIDPSMTATGVAVLRNGITYTLTATSPSTEDAVTRWRRILAKVWREVEGSTLMIVEDLPVGKFDVSAMFVERAGLLGLLRYGADARGIPVALVNVGTLKLFATGSGRASKQQMTRDAMSQLHQAPRNDNESDALWLLAMGCAHYLNPLVNPLAVHGLSTKRLATLDRVRWPNWRYEQ
jgi:crossover junction endodeoxyribonuclease RuvC